MYITYIYIYIYIYMYIYIYIQAVSRLLPTAAAQVRSELKNMGFMVDELAQEQVFSEYFSFPFQFSLHSMLHIRIPSGGDTTDPIMAGVSTPPLPHPT
jgi:hypothetical protein